MALDAKQGNKNNHMDEDEEESLESYRNIECECGQSLEVSRAKNLYGVDIKDGKTWNNICDNPQALRVGRVSRGNDIVFQCTNSVHRENGLDLCKECGLLYRHLPATLYYK